MTATAPRGVELEAQSRADVDAVKPVDLLPSTQNPLYLPTRGLSFQGVFGRLFFHHLSKLVQVGYARRLEPADLYAAKELKIDELSAEFEADWAHQLTLEKPSLWAALSRGSGRVLFVSGLMHAAGSASNFASPLLLQQIIGGLACVPSATTACPTTRTLYGYAVLLFASNAVYNIMASHERMMLNILGLRLRAKLMAAVYRKTLRLSSGALQEESAGRIVTLMSNDAQKLQEFFPMIHEIWAAPALIALSLWLLFNVLSWSTFVGMAVIFLLLPMTGIVAGKLFGMRRGLVALADKRVSLITEVINGIRIIKFYAWETSFMKRVLSVREEELGYIWRINKVSAVFGVLLFAAPVLIGVAAIGTYSLTDGTLTSARLYTALSCFNLIRFPLVFLPFIIISFLNSKVALERLHAFLIADEADSLSTSSSIEVGRVSISGPASFHYPQPAPKKPEPEKKGRPGRGGPPADEPEAGKPDETQVEVEAPSPPFKLTGVSLEIPPGSLTLVIGSVGSGKSTLLAAINQYLVRDAGAVAVGGSLAFAAQTAWILNATVEKNILFGLPKDAARYALAIASSQLEPDLAMLQFGDQTEIGERGVTLSGGQKQRVSIARLVYAGADVNLLDDPLSAVDAHVGAALFDKCFRGALAGKTRVLVTNALSYLPQADQIVVMEAGAVREVGTFAALREKGTDFDALCATHEIHAEEEGATTADTKKRKSLDKSSRASLDKSSRASLDKKPAKAAEPANDKNLTGAEERTLGKISSAVYVTYARAAGSVAVLAILFFAFSCEYGSKSFLDAWLGFWAADRFNWSTHNKTHYYLLVYACVFVANSCFTYGRSLTFYFFGVRASRNMHLHMLQKVMRLPQSFFDSTPSGRVINRFSRDTEVLDSLLPMVLVQMVGCFFNIFTTFVIICVASQWFIIALPFLLASYVAVQRYYIPSCCELQRIESITRSPIYSDLGEAVAGVATIRAYGRASQFIAASDAAIAKNGDAIVTQRLAAEWLNVRLRFIGMAVSTLAAFLVISGGVAPGLAGLTLVYALDVTKYMEHGTAQASDAESKMNSVERMIEYDKNAEEAALETSPEVAATLPLGWPRSGSLALEKVELRYRPELPLVLRGISFEAASGDKIGIVGRTGSGKSSMFQAIFRIVEAEAGRIMLDGVDTKVLGLHALRQALSMIPQDPFLFGGSIRNNLDPFGEYRDESLWEALERVGLKVIVEADSKKLDMEVVDEGANFSLGQRQLLCMGRALLRKSRVLMMDEATASIDMDSDALIQNTVRTCFMECTVLTIAHRINTVIDSDKVLVLDGGCVAEFGEPHSLLSYENGQFAGLVDGSGQRNSMYLRRLARESSLRKASPQSLHVDEAPGQEDMLAAEST